jgi:hypothetical protein
MLAANFAPVAAKNEDIARKLTLKTSNMSLPLTEMLK